MSQAGGKRKLFGRSNAEWVAAIQEMYGVEMSSAAFQKRIWKAKRDGYTEREALEKVDAHCRRLKALRERQEEEDARSSQNFVNPEDQ